MSVSFQYEILIRRAYQCDRYGVPAADTDVYEGLRHDEHDANTNLNNKQIQTAYQRKLRVIKNYIIDALKQGIVRLDPIVRNSEQSAISALIAEVNRATSVNDLNLVIRKSLDKFIELKIEMS